MRENALWQAREAGRAYGAAQLAVIDFQPPTPAPPPCPPVLFRRRRQRHDAATPVLLRARNPVAASVISCYALFEKRVFAQTPLPPHAPAAKKRSVAPAIRAIPPAIFVPSP